ncbi:MAG: hypothetical protein NXH75_18225 [Halobacteriovoraceae bacterium]|nr:hypothetical protein [Halobacteriovoraceae bacterium]
MLKLMSYVPYILFIFLMTQHPVWGVERCEGPDCPEPAIPGLRTEVPEAPVTGDGEA